MGKAKMTIAKMSEKMRSSNSEAGAVMLRR